MTRGFRIGGEIFTILAETKPSRGPIFIGSTTDDIGCLEGIVHCCFDFRKIFFALVYRAEKYDKVRGVVFEKVADHYPHFTEKIPGEIFSEHLAAQLVPRAELTNDRNESVQLPNCVVYTGRIDNDIKSLKATSREFVEILCDYYGLSRMLLPRKQEGHFYTNQIEK